MRHIGKLFRIQISRALPKRVHSAFKRMTHESGGTHAAVPLLLIVALLNHGFPAAAQTTYSSVVGNVTDASGASVPDVAISVTNDATNVKFATQTDQNGNYTMDKLIAGQYTVSAERAGFKRYVNQGVTLLSQQSLRVNILLVVGEVTTDVTVQAEAPVIETESGQVGFTRTSQELKTLPVITPSGGQCSATFPTRDPMNYVFSMPGASVSRPTSAGKITINGANQGSTIVRVDGNTIRDNSNGIGLGGRPMLEAVDEVKLIGINAAAEFDGQATILISTKSGGNDIHGGAFYEGQQRALNAQFWQLSGRPKPFTRRNTGGAYVGGPIKKNKAFYFGSWEAERTIRGVTLNRNLPLPAFKIGDFSQLIDPSFVSQYLGGRPIMIRDPLNNNAPFPGNIIPSDRINSVSKSIQSEFFQDNPFLPGLALNAPIGQTAPINADKFDVRIDYNFSQAHRMFGHFNLGEYSEDYFVGTWPDSRTKQGIPTKQFSISDTYAFSPTMVNEFKFGHNRQHSPADGYLQANGREYQKEWGIQGIGRFAGPPTINGLPMFIYSEPPIDFDSRNYEIVDNLSILKGKHNFKMGYSLARPSFFFYYTIGWEGNWTFGNQFTGYNYADFLLGYPTSSTLEFPPDPGINARSLEHNYYFQDTFQVSPKLTLDYGIRYQYHPRATAEKDLLANFDPITKGIVVASELSLQSVSKEFPTNIPVTTADRAGYPRSMLNNDSNDIAPRIGFAYRLDGKGDTVLRGGYGIYYETYNLNMSTTLGNFGIYRGAQVSQNFVIPGTTIPELRFPSPYRTFVPGTGNVSYSAADKDLPNGRFQQANLTLERALWGNRLAVSWLGNYGKHAIGFDLNQPVASTTPFGPGRRPIANFDRISFFNNDNILNYNSLQIVGERRFKEGLFFRASYNWTKTLTRADNDTGPVGGTTVENSYAVSAEKSNINWTPRHSALFTYSYELPFGPGKRFLSKSHSVLGQVVGGWQLNGISTFRTGLWFNPTYSGYDPSGTGRVSGRPDRIGDGKLAAGDRTLTKWFDPSAFTCPGQAGPICTSAAPIGRFGNAGRNILDGPGAKRWDFSIFKNFPIRESIRFQVRTEFVNLFNTPQFANPAANISDPGTVGRITTTIPGTNRQVQFGARFEF